MRVMRAIRSGAVLEKEVYCVPDGRKLTKKTEPPVDKEPLTTEEKAEICRRKSERLFIRKVNSTFTSRSYYVTLTYDDFNLPVEYSQAERNLDNFLRRLKRWQPELRYVAVTGYGQKSNRLHHHLIIDGNYIDTNKVLELWTAGSVKRIEPLRNHNYYNGIDYGEDYTALAIYLHRHSNAKPKGKRWKESRNIVSPVMEKPQEVKREINLERPPKAPKGYRYVGYYQSDFNQGGYISFKYVRETADMVCLSETCNCGSLTTTSRKKE